MKLKITLYSVCLLMLLAACQQDGPTPEPSVGSRTVFVYMIAQTNQPGSRIIVYIHQQITGCGINLPHSLFHLFNIGSPADSSGKRQKRKSGGRDH